MKKVIITLCLAWLICVSKPIPGVKLGNPTVFPYNVAYYTFEASQWHPTKYGFSRVVIQKGEAEETFYIGDANIVKVEEID